MIDACTLFETQSLSGYHSITFYFVIFKRVRLLKCAGFIFQKYTTGHYMCVAFTYLPSISSNIFLLAGKETFFEIKILICYLIFYTVFSSVSFTCFLMIFEESLTRNIGRLHSQLSGLFNVFFRGLTSNVYYNTLCEIKVEQVAFTFDLFDDSIE